MGKNIYLVGCVCVFSIKIIQIKPGRFYYILRRRQNKTCSESILKEMTVSLKRKVKINDIFPMYFNKIYYVSNPFYFSEIALEFE